MIIRVLTGTISLIVGSPPHRKTTRLYAGDDIEVDEGQHVEIIADAASTAEFRAGKRLATRLARPVAVESVDEAHVESSSPA